MSTEPPVCILFRGGRLPTWYQLAPETRESIEQEHVDSMLAVANQHQLRRLEGFRLVAPQGGWERFWVIEFSTMTGAEAWIEAEMAPDYGSYGFFDYQLARQTLSNNRPNWLATTSEKITAWTEDPHQIPALAIETNNAVVLIFEWDDPENRQLLQEDSMVPTLGAEYGVRKLELFRLIAPHAKSDRVWLAEVATLALAEQWIEALTAAGQSDWTERHFQLARKWAPTYFASWIPK